MGGKTFLHPHTVYSSEESSLVLSIGFFSACVLSMDVFQSSIYNPVLFWRHLPECAHVLLSICLHTQDGDVHIPFPCLDLTAANQTLPTLAIISQIPYRHSRSTWTNPLLHFSCVPPPPIPNLVFLSSLSQWMLFFNFFSLFLHIISMTNFYSISVEFLLFFHLHSHSFFIISGPYLVWTMTI